MTISIKDKISVENIKSLSQQQITNASQSLYNSAIQQAKSYLTDRISAILSAGQAAAQAFLGGLSTFFSKARFAVTSAIFKSVGDASNILDPARSQLSTFASSLPSLPSFPTSLPNLGDFTSSIQSSVLLLLNNISPIGVTEVINLLTTIGDRIQGIRQGVTLVDNTSDVAAGLPETNEDVLTNNRAFINAKEIKKAESFALVEQRIEGYNKLVATTIGEKLYVRDKLIGLSQSSDVYQDGIDSIYTSPVSDNVCLLTLGHTIDTPSLDPEDWMGNEQTERIETDNVQLVLQKGPANLYPVTSKYKVNQEVATFAQNAYEQINLQMYRNMYRDRYMSSAFGVNANTITDYGVSRYTSGRKYGLKVLSVSHNNMGDYASLAFAKQHSTSEDELANSEVDPQLTPLIGYLNNINNLNVIEDKPVYETQIQDTSILIDSRGNRYILPASSPDDTPVKVE